MVKVSEDFIFKRLTGKPISKEALARCVEQETHNSDLAARIRDDNSFDVMLVSTGFVDHMKVAKAECDVSIPIYPHYCGHAIQKALELLPYYKGWYYTFSGTIALRR